ncbi:MAG TPA: RIO1 family regulatory kinase/ATPase [Candidatus Kapabacteria bacterium]|nr:RIO1 family regulatory kinase/ATPase [Candidatus Kapabacteria bacterium]
MARRDDSEESFQRIKQRRPRLRTGSALPQLVVDAERARQFEQAHGEPAPTFDHRDLQELHERGLLDELIAPILRGKEASVFAGRRGSAPVAVKLYTDVTIRSFRKDASYREGRFIGDTRIERAIEHHSRRGLAASQAIWVEEEYRQLRTLGARGVRVPRPIGHAGMAIVMEFIGDDGVAAPRLAEAELTPREAHVAFAAAVDALVRLVRSGLVHGDYSTYNLLWWRGEVVVIDLPQVVEITRNPNAVELMQRDVRSLCASFARIGVRSDPEVIERLLLAEIPRDLHPQNRAESVHAPGRSARR